MPSHPAPQFYQTPVDLNIYDSPQFERLATQAAAGRQLQIVTDLQNWPIFQNCRADPTKALPVCLYEDDYPGWLAAADRDLLTLAANQPYPPQLTAAEIQAQIPAILALCQAAMGVSNHYLWGGAVAPNYDCSGLMQHSFAAQGIWLPRDAYQQEAFCEPITSSATPATPAALLPHLLPGDLIFFGTPVKATHVGIYLGSGKYLHSSGKEQGRNGIGIDSLIELDHPVAQAYSAQFRGAGRVVSSYLPKGANR
jgi:cell wall-associated NlpC family hydrolase